MSSTVQPARRKAKKKGRHLRDPAGFLKLEGWCFSCNCYVRESLRSEHKVHTPGPEFYTGAMLLRPRHLDTYARLLHRMIMTLIEYLHNVTTRQDLVSHLAKCGATNDEPHKPTWSMAQKHGIQRYFDQYGGMILPDFITLNPPNSCLLLAHPPIIATMMTGGLRRYLHRHT